MEPVPPKSSSPQADNCGSQDVPARVKKGRGARGRKSGDGSLSPEMEEARRARQERLVAIRKAVEAGEYDSDELLEKALERMIRRIQSDGG